MGKPKVPDTIGAAKMKDLQRRAERANTESMFSKRNVERRKASEQQRKNAGKS